MLLPIGSNLPFFRIPWATGAWMILCVMTFLFITYPEIEKAELHSKPPFKSLDFKETKTYAMAFVPAEQSASWVLVTYQFIHSSWGHLLANLWYLAVFGWMLENALGPGLFIFLSLAAGAVAVLPEWFVQKDQSIPIVGASGSIAFMMGALVMMFPRSKIRLLWTIIPIPNFPSSFFIPLRYLIYFWLVMQASGMAAHVFIEARPVAFATHLTGFLIGLALGVLYRPISAKDMVDIELSGSDLKKFYASLQDYRDQKFEEAFVKLKEVSSKQPWLFKLQLQVFRLAVVQGHRRLADEIWPLILRHGLIFHGKDELSFVLAQYFGEFGELPSMTLHDRVQACRLIEKSAPAELLDRLKSV